MKIDHLKTARAFAHLMDNQFEVFGIHFGLDTVIGIVPGFGDFLTFILSLYLIWVGYQMKIPQAQISKMIGNILIDTAIGSIPILGDIGDIFFKANVKNLRVLEKYQNIVVEGEIIS